MKRESFSRREFLSTTAGLAAAASVPYWWTSVSQAQESKNDRPLVAAIGTGDRFKALGGHATKHADFVAVCDADRLHAEFGEEKTGGKADIYEDYRQVLDRKDVEAVIVATPDHWHSKIAVEAMLAGKDVYCEKPLTLTIDEGKLICKTVKETKRVCQVGSQQRSEMGGPIGLADSGMTSPARFLTAVALVRAGRIGKVHKVTAAIGAPAAGGPFKKEKPPAELNWELWLGQAPIVDYIKERCHYEFRWWYEYSGGKLTDWGAHHVDIAQWAIGAEGTGPILVEGTGTHSVAFSGGYPMVDDQYNTAIEFLVTARFANGVELVIRHDTDNGILFEGDKGRLFVSRGSLRGKCVDQLKDDPLPEDALTKLCKGNKPGSHMRNFFECVQSRGEPISDVFSHHRAISTCHLANIAIRLGRKLNFDPSSEQIVGDDEANGWLKREPRKGYEVAV